MAKPRKAKQCLPQAGGGGGQSKRRPASSSQLLEDSHDRIEKGLKKTEQSSYKNRVVTCLALLCGALNSYNGYTLFENDRYFSHLSNLEREMTFRTEMGLYYSYYKTVVNAPNLPTGIAKLVVNNVTEYPSNINTLKRFNLYPELVIGLGYRIFSKLAAYLGVQTKNCWMIDRKELPAVESCTGLGDLAIYYVVSVYAWNAVTGIALVGLAYVVSGSVLGAILTSVVYFCNYNESTRIQWTPPLRESFAYPFLLFHMFQTTRLLRAPVGLLPSVAYVVTTTCSLLFWQFSQFALLTEICSLFAVYSIHSRIHWSQLQYIAAMHFCSVFIAYIMLFTNDMLLTSMYTATVTATIIVVNARLLNTFKKPVLKTLLQLLLLAVTAVGIKLFLWFVLRVTDDSHIWNILLAKLTDYRDFHTMLYTCAPEFDFLKVDYFKSLWPTLLVPLAVALTLVCTQVFRRQQLPPELLLNLYQCLAFLAMAFMVMRLKMFLTPHLCILASLAVPPRFLSNKFPLRSVVVAALVGIIVLPGWNRLVSIHSHKGEYSNPNLEELLIFIDDYAEPTDSFAGPMPLMANILLSTGRPIVNHPHYEDSRLRAKTERIYTLLSRKTLREVYDHLKKLKVCYIVLSRAWCHGKMRTGCALVDIWDELDPLNKFKPQVCDRLASDDTEGLFQIIFHNEEYTMLRLK
ncbi:probable C-mannosyltransferase DPY19L1 [Varroa jacobsoni]|uniref:probable C-mannosyltransferase DPY19L1 n=1 Tax=Varroa jacobsoni TaxID=62625 RepID=UPI000BF871C1|nr:probable C-mannosyltransferase DPY19L1 [Varroa jacobsoni]